MLLGAPGEDSGHQSMGASFSTAAAWAWGWWDCPHRTDPPRATGIAGCSQSIPVYLEQDD